MIDKKGQVAVFVIIALVIVGGIVLLYSYREQIFVKSIPAELRPVFDYYQSCVEEQGRAAIDLAESQGGRVDPGVYIPGSEYAPFSSQLNFLGFPVPYWYYVSGNGLIKENVPSKSEIESEISSYVEERVNENCNFDDFYAKEFSIELGTPNAKTRIEDNKIIIDVNSDISVSKGESSAIKGSHSADISTNLGKLYKTATDIYSKQKSEAFLENYSVDVLRNYAPVDGVEIGCSGKIWKTREVVDELKSGLEANVGAIKFKGDYYTSKEENEYFIVNLPVEEQVNLIYSRNWPTKVEIFGADDELIIAKPVGAQRGMGVIGFCYAPYHFVYDLSYPVMIQVIISDEIFQFPVVVIIDNNVPREGLASTTISEEPSFDICEIKTQDIKVNVYDSELNKVNANLSYTCFNQKCLLGDAINGEFEGKAPACVNGLLGVNAQGYSEKKETFSTNEESFREVILDKEYDVKLALEVGGRALEGNAIISFESEQKSVTTALPDSESIKLSEGLYNITIYAYGNSSLTLPASTKRQCAEVARGGILGLFGSTKEECFDISIPETKIDSALIGGGKSEIYILPSDLQKGEFKLRVDSLPKPNSLEELQNNFVAFEAMGVELVI